MATRQAIPIITYSFYSLAFSQLPFTLTMKLLVMRRNWASWRMGRVPTEVDIPRYWVRCWTIFQNMISNNSIINIIHSYNTYSVSKLLILVVSILVHSTSSLKVTRLAGSSNNFLLERLTTRLSNPSHPSITKEPTQQAPRQQWGTQYQGQNPQQATDRWWWRYRHPYTSLYPQIAYSSPMLSTR